MLVSSCPLKGLSSRSLKVLDFSEGKLSFAEHLLQAKGCPRGLA